MKISQIPVFNFYPNRIQQPNVRLNTLDCDTVSFSAKKKKVDNSKSQNVQTGVQLGKEIIDELSKGASKKKITDIVQKEMPSLQVKSAREIGRFSINPDGYVAYFTSDLGDNFEMDKNMVMYLNQQSFRIGDATEKLTFAMDVAHEYTHALQVKEGKEQELLKQLSDNDIGYAKTITGIANMAFEKMDRKLQEKFILGYFGSPNDRINFMKYGREIPKEAFVTKQNLLANMKLQNESDFRKLAEEEFQIAFWETIEFMAKHPQNVDTPILNCLMELAQTDRMEELCDKTKQLCKHLANIEAEARTTESVLAKGYLGTTKTLNIDCYPVYFEMLNKAL